MEMISIIRNCPLVLSAAKELTLIALFLIHNPIQHPMATIGFPDFQQRRKIPFKPFTFLKDDY